MGTTRTKKFTLPNEIITVKYIKRKRGMAANVDDNHVIAGGLLETARVKYFAPLQKNGQIANLLSVEEKEYLEEILGLNLSVYGDYWTEKYVSLYKSETANKFDLSDPSDYISFKILEASSEVAPSWAARANSGLYRFAITREGELRNEVKKGLDIKKAAFKLYGKIEDDKDKLISVLRLINNKPISDDSKLEWIQGLVEEIVDTEPAKFLSVADDSSFETKALITKAVAKKVIVKKGSEYITKDGLELCEAGSKATFANAVKYLEDDKNQEVRLVIEAKLEKA